MTDQHINMWILNECTDVGTDAGKVNGKNHQH